MQNIRCYISLACERRLQLDVSRIRGNYLKCNQAIWSDLIFQRDSIFEAVLKNVFKIMQHRFPLLLWPCQDVVSLSVVIILAD